MMVMCGIYLAAMPWGGVFSPIGVCCYSQIYILIVKGGVARQQTENRKSKFPIPFHNEAIDGKCVFLCLAIRREAECPMRDNCRVTTASQSRRGGEGREGRTLKFGCVEEGVGRWSKHLI